MQVELQAKKVTVIGKTQVMLSSLYACEDYFVRVQTSRPYHSELTDIVVHSTAPSEFYFPSEGHL